VYKQTELKNGTRVVSHHMPHMDSVALGIWIAAGGRYETRPKAGIYHFIEHLLFDGTKKRSGIQIKQAIEGVGGSLNGFTGEEFTCYLVKMLARHYGLGLDVLSDMVLNAVFKPRNIIKEKSVICEEIKMYNDLPAHYAVELLDQLLWPGHPLGMNLAGTVKSVKSITKRDIEACKAKAYTPANIAVVATGAVKHAELVDSVSGFFSGVAAGKRLRFKSVNIRQDRPRHKLYFKQTEQTHIALGVHSVSHVDPDRFAVSLLHIILGANMSSRLFQEIREKRGLAYAISTHVKKHRDTGAFLVTAGVKNEKAVEALKVTLGMLNRIKQKGVTASELKRAKDYYVGQLLMALEDTAEHMIWMGEQLICIDRISNAQQILKKVNAVTKEDLSRLAKQLFSAKNLNLAVVGPLEEKVKSKITGALDIL